jgi:phage-related protein
MTTPVFTWSPLVEPTGTTKFSTVSAQFGDGYSQAAANGINNKADSWPLTFLGISAEIQPIKDFLDSLQGYKSFYWTPPLRSQGLFRCAEYSFKPYGGDIYEITATFAEVFSP